MENHKNIENFDETEQNYQVQGTSTGNSPRNVDEWVQNVNNNMNEVLEDRINNLRVVMKTLQKELTEERALWKRELDEVAHLMSVRDRFDSEPNLPSDLGSELKLGDLKNESGSEPNMIRDYEERLNRYQGALAQAQAEKRLNIRRQIAANSYRKRLFEVEKLCEEELAKVRHTAQSLEPLKQMASDWSKPKLTLDTIKYPPTSKTLTSEDGENEEGGIGDYVQNPESSCQITKRDQSIGHADCVDIPIQHIDASLVVDDEAPENFGGQIIVQISNTRSRNDYVNPTICYSATYE